MHCTNGRVPRLSLAPAYREKGGEQTRKDIKEERRDGKQWRVVIKGFKLIGGVTKGIAKYSN